MNTNRYDADVVAWSKEQAAFIRERRFELLDIEHLADEIEDVGKSEQRELESRMAILVSHLLKWQFQPERRGNSWKNTIIEQRKRIVRRIQQTPSLKSMLSETDWWHGVWADALDIATRETGFLYERFPEHLEWSYQQIVSPDFWPN